MNNQMLQNVSLVRLTSSNQHKTAFAHQYASALFPPRTHHTLWLSVTLMSCTMPMMKPTFHAWDGVYPKTTMLTSSGRPGPWRRDGRSAEWVLGIQKDPPGLPVRALMGVSNPCARRSCGWYTGIVRQTNSLSSSPAIVPRPALSHCPALLHRQSLTKP